MATSHGVAPLSPVRPGAAKLSVTSSPSSTNGRRDSNGHGDAEDDDDWRDNPSFKQSIPVPIIPPSPSSAAVSVNKSAPVVAKDTASPLVPTTTTANGAASNRVSVPNGGVATPIVQAQQPPATKTNGGSGSHARSVSDVTSLGGSTAKVEKKSLFKNFLGGFGGTKKTATTTATTPVRETKRDATAAGTPSPLVTQSSVSALHTLDTSGDDSPLSPTSASSLASGMNSISGNMASFANAIAGSSPFAFFRKKKGDADEW